MTNPPENEKPTRRIVIMKNGSYHVFGNIPLVHKTQIVSEFGEPLTWEKDKVLSLSKIRKAGIITAFAAVVTLRTNLSAMARTIKLILMEPRPLIPVQPKCARSSFPGGTRIVVKKDTSLCMDSGFCGLRDTEISELVANSSDTKARGIGHCHGGTLPVWRVDLPH